MNQKYAGNVDCCYPEPTPTLTISSTFSNTISNSVEYVLNFSLGSQIMWFVMFPCMHVLH